MKTGRRKEIVGKTKNWPDASVIDNLTNKPIKGVVAADETTGSLLRVRRDKHQKVMYNDEGLVCTIAETRDFRIIRKPWPIRNLEKVQ